MSVIDVSCSSRRLIQTLGVVVTYILVVMVCPLLGSPPDAPTNLRINDVVNPVGIGDSPFFGWYVNDPDTNEIQTAYQILAASSKALLDADKGDVWDSGKVPSGLQNHVHFMGNPLQSDHLYFWKVRTWDRNGDSGDWSEPGRFAVGLLKNEDWSDACWIRRDTGDADDYTYYRKKVELPDKIVERASVYISGVHKYALYVNGRLAGKGPAYHYPQYQYYNGYDITALVQPGRSNQFAVFNHWFGGGQGRPTSERGVILKAIIHYSDRTSTVIGSDGSWRQSRAKAWGLKQPHRNRGEGVGYIEKIDAREMVPDWNKPDFDDSSWENATVIGSHPVKPWTGTLTPDLTRIEERRITPVSIIHKENNRYLVDLGKVYAGMPLIHFSGGSAGDMVEMQAGYALDSSGRIDPDKNQSTDMRYYAVLSGGSFTYEPVEYLGMRYFEINNSPMPVTESNFSFIVRHSAMDETLSSFASSDATLNAVWHLMKHSLLTCAQEEFVDTPTREKGGFLGDAAIQSTVAMPVMNERVLTQRVLNEYLQSMDQHWSDPAERGRMNAVYPNRDGKRDIPDFTQAYLLWAWNYYMETGDREFLETNYGKFKNIADYVYRYQDEHSGLITNLEGGAGAYKYGIVDWPASMRFGYDMTASRTVINGWAYADFEVLAKMAGELEKTTDHTIYQNRADDLKADINACLVNEAGLYVDGLDVESKRSPHISQQANMFPLALGIVPNDHVQKVVDEIKKRKMSVGMVTLPWLIRALGEAEEGEHLIELFTNQDWLGWARCLSLGATATWEEWDACNTDASMSHAWGASGLEGYVHYILGIRPLKPQYEQVQIKPLDFGTGLEWAHGTIPTDRGKIEVSWKKAPDVYMLKLNLPVNMTARVFIPGGNTDRPVVDLDGTAMEAIKVGNYIVIENIGSGEHTLIRKDPAFSL